MPLFLALFLSLLLWIFSLLSQCLHPMHLCSPFTILWSWLANNCLCRSSSQAASDQFVSQKKEKTLFDVQQLDWWPIQWLGSPLEAHPERQTVETFTYEATDGQMKLSASRSGICQHQCVQPNIQSAKQASTVSQPLPVPSPPQLQSYVDWKDRAAEPGLWEHNGEVIQGFSLSLEAFVLTVELSSRKTCCQTSRRPFALCDSDSDVYKAKQRPDVTCELIRRTFILKGKHSLYSFFVLTLPVLPGIRVMNVHHKNLCLEPESIWVFSHQCAPNLVI